jgi:predicted GIY-YIG superfamily endonuclease
MYNVYWIKSSEHTNPNTQGYVGITKNLKERLKAHKKNKHKTPFTCAIKKYGFKNLIVVVLHEVATLQEALSIEETLRPTGKIGWNCQKGGELGVESSWYNNEANRNKHKEATALATKEAIKLKDTKEARSNRAKDNWKTGAYKDSFTGSKNPKALLNETQVVEIKYSLLPKFSNKEIATMFNVKPHVIQFIRSGKNWRHI